MISSYLCGAASLFCLPQALLDAADEGDVSKVRECLRWGANINWNWHIHNEQLVSKMPSDRRLHDSGASLRASHLKYALQTVFHDLNLNLTRIYTRTLSANFEQL